MGREALDRPSPIPIDRGLTLVDMSREALDRPSPIPIGGAALDSPVQQRGETSRVLVRRSTPTTSRAAGRPHWDLSLNRERTARSHRCFPGVPRSEGPGPPSAIKIRRLLRIPVATASRDLDERTRTHRHDVLGSSRIPRRKRNRHGNVAARLATGVVPQHEVFPDRFGRACPAAESGPFDRSIR